MWWGLGHMDEWAGTGFGILMFIVMLLFWVLLIVGTIVLIRYLLNPRGKDFSVKTPLQILEERYARGEIDKKEFEEKKQDLL